MSMFLAAAVSIFLVSIVFDPKRFASNSFRIRFEFLLNPFQSFTSRVSLGVHLTPGFLSGRSLFTLPPRNSISGWIISPSPSPLRPHLTAPPLACLPTLPIACRKPRNPLAGYTVGCIANRITSNHDGSCLTCCPITQARLHAYDPRTIIQKRKCNICYRAGVSYRPRIRQRLKSTGRRCCCRLFMETSLDNFGRRVVPLTDHATMHWSNCGTNQPACHSQFQACRSGTAPRHSPFFSRVDRSMIENLRGTRPNHRSQERY